jgi:hypothetical protein
MANNLDTAAFHRLQAENAELNRMHETFVLQWKAGTLPRPSVQWHQHIEDIDKDILAKAINRKLAADSFTVIPAVDVEVLLDKMRKVDANFYRKKVLYEDSHDRQTSRVLRHWYNREKLIPPTIMVFNQEYFDFISLDAIPSKELQPVDGKHRLNIAYYYETLSIPILVWNKQIDLITRILQK